MQECIECSRCRCRPLVCILFRFRLEHECIPQQLRCGAFVPCTSTRILGSGRFSPPASSKSPNTAEIINFLLCYDSTSEFQNYPSMLFLPLSHLKPPPEKYLPTGACCGASSLIYKSSDSQATDDGGTLIIVNGSTGELYKVDPETGGATVIDLGGKAVFGDGLVRYKTSNMNGPCSTRGAGLSSTVCMYGNFLALT